MATSLTTCAPPSNTWFLGPIRPHCPNGISIGSAIFAEMTVCVRILHNGTPLPQKIAPFHRGIWTPSKTRFPGLTRVLNANSISIGSAVLQGSLVWQTSLTDRPTDHATRSVTTGRKYVRLANKSRYHQILHVHIIYVFIYFSSNFFLLSFNWILGKYNRISPDNFLLHYWLTFQIIS